MASRFTNDTIRIVNKVTIFEPEFIYKFILKVTKLSVFSFIQKICGFQKLNASVQVIHYLILIWKLLTHLFIY